MTKAPKTKSLYSQSSHTIRLKSRVMSNGIFHRDSKKKLSVGIAVRSACMKIIDTSRIIKAKSDHTQRNRGNPCAKNDHSQTTVY